MANISKAMRRHAREMRRVPTISENRLWFWLRDRRCLGYKFKRQAPIGPYIADFYCAQLQLVIEVDGAHHYTPWMNEYDGARTLYLAARGIRVLRIPNELLRRDSQLAGDQIRAAIEQPPHPPSAPSPPRAGEKE